MRVLTMAILIFALTSAYGQHGDYIDIISNGDEENPKGIRVYSDDKGFDLKILGNYAPAKEVYDVLTKAKRVKITPAGMQLRIEPDGATLEETYTQVKDLILQRYGFRPRPLATKFEL